MKAKKSSRQDRSRDRKGRGLSEGNDRKGAGEAVNLEERAGAGPWDGEIDPERGNSCVRRFMRWYRQRLGLSLHQVHERTGIDRAYLRRLERRRIHLSLTVLWRWCNGLHVNVDWVLKLTRRQVQEAGQAAAASPAREGGSRAAPCANPAGGADCAHEPAATAAAPFPPVPTGAPAGAAGAPPAGAPENSFPHPGECPAGLEKSLAEDVHFAHLPEKSWARCGESPLGLEKSFAGCGESPLGLEKSFAGCGESPLGAEKSFARCGESPLGLEKSFPRRGESPLGPKKSPAHLLDMVFPPQDCWL